MNIFEIIAENKIKAAMQNGEFNDLKGEGKPLALDENPFNPQNREW